MHEMTDRQESIVTMNYLTVARKIVYKNFGYKNKLRKKVFEKNWCEGKPLSFFFESLSEK